MLTANDGLVAECEACGCFLLWDALSFAVEVMAAEWRVGFDCHCGWESEFEVATWDWLAWIDEHALVIRELLSELVPEEIAYSWLMQQVAAPATIPVEVDPLAV